MKRTSTPRPRSVSASVLQRMTWPLPMSDDASVRMAAFICPDWQLRDRVRFHEAAYCFLRPLLEKKPGYVILSKVGIAVIGKAVIQQLQRGKCVEQFPSEVSLE